MTGKNSVLFYHNDKLLRYDTNGLHNADFKENKTLFTGAFVPSQYLRTFSFKLPKSLSSEELAMHVEIKMYNEGGLSAEKEYTIDFLHFDAGEHYLIEAFAVEEQECKAIFGSSLKKLEAVDLIFPRFLIYQTLYEKQSEFSKQCDLFIYLGDEEAFGALYLEGKYIGSRNITTLSTLSKQSGIELAKLKEYLKQKGFVHANYSLEEMHIIDTLQQILLKDIEKLVYSINPKRGIFGIEGLGNVYVDFEGDSIEGIKEFFIPFGYADIEIKPITFEGVAPKELDIVLACRYLLALQDSSELQKINLSCLERKKPLREYESFRFLAVAAVTLLVVISVYFYLSHIEEKQEALIEKEQQQLRENRAKLKKILTRFKELKAQTAQISDEIAKEQRDIFVYETTLRAIPIVQQEKLKRQQFMNDILEAMRKYRLNAQYITQKNAKEARVMLISKSDNRDTISKFMQTLLHKGYSKVYTNKIHYEYGVYLSEVRILK